MNQDKKNVFLSHDHLWCSQTKRINHENQVAVLCTHTGFFTRSGAKKDYKETTRLFQKELAALKDSSHCPFLLSEYLDYWFHKIYLPACTCKNTAVRYRWIIENVILPNMETDPLIQTVDTGYMEDLIRSCQKYCKGTEHAVYELLCSVTESAWKQGHLKQELVLPPVRKKRPEPMISLYTREQTRLFLEAVYQAPCPHRLEFFLALFCGLQPGEILGLTYDDFNPDTYILSVRKHYIKNQQPSAGIPRYSCRELEEQRCRSFEIPDFVCEELIQRKEKNRHFFSVRSVRKEDGFFCISSHGTVKTQETLNAGLKCVTEKQGIPSITMRDLCNMFVWFLLVQNCPLEKVRFFTGGVRIGDFFYG